MVVNVSGMLMVWSDLQLAKAELPIVVTWFPKTTVSRLLLLENQLLI